MNMSIKSPKITDSVPMLWRKLMQAYIRSSGLQQLNIPEPEREHLLNLTSEPPPRPCELHEACKCAYDLLNDSLAAFLRAPQAPTGSLQVPSEHSDQRSQLQPSESGNTSTHLRHSLCVPESEVLVREEVGISESAGFLAGPGPGWFRHMFATASQFCNRVTAVLGCTHRK